MKKLFMIFLLMCTCFALNGCYHEHTPENLISIGIEEHWHACEICEKKLDAQPHTFDEDGACTVCTASFTKDNYGSVEACAWDEFGTLILSIQYDYKGNAIGDFRCVIEYDDDGNIASEIIYRDRRLTSEKYYAPCENSEYGASYVRLRIHYNMDGTKTTDEYDEYRLLKSTAYDADGKVSEVKRYEQERNSEGKLIRHMIFTNDILTSETVYTHVEQVESLPGKRVEYDGNGEAELECQYVYDDRLYLVKEIYYSYGVLDWEYHYSQDSEGVFYVSTEVYYSENGNIKQEVYYSLDENDSFYRSREVKYNDKGQIVSDISYDREGHKIY